ncbi:hypothetical protein K461DRAFT_264626 [Myriangium duriaei CBS 260.36]|uniref:Uncharacterized protein n=1 Tax=Myriangium duriaei CBS 260.36 TaxID=1168546 RepID=A0A9P4JBW1_9PEZI|nr:hypothetical protein K461DRAFT_264626 [Myriangium duriaei CBS 260.36]
MRAFVKDVYHKLLSSCEKDKDHRPILEISTPFDFRKEDGMSFYFNEDGSPLVQSSATPSLAHSSRSDLAHNDSPRRVPASRPLKLHFDNPASNPFHDQSLRQSNDPSTPRSSPAAYTHSSPPARSEFVSRQPVLNRPRSFEPLLPNARLPLTPRNRVPAVERVLCTEEDLDLSFITPILLRLNGAEWAQQDEEKEAAQHRDQGKRERRNAAWRL